jgi:hypothetical protein
VAAEVALASSAGSRRIGANIGIRFPGAIRQDVVFNNVTLPGTIFKPRAVGLCLALQQVVVL